VGLVSGGRFVLGVGQGYVQHEFETLGFDRKQRPSLFEEGIEVIRRAWEEGRIGYEGKRWRFDDLPFEPRPERPTPDLHRCLRRPRDRPRSPDGGWVSNLRSLGRG
jgi:alkanesulfonate monooxygenase SsuD/methylene tetrahydromethanopterin reductase-like flavin-dependent oxidoreductase (luciferase family)